MDDETPTSVHIELEKIESLFGFDSISDDAPNYDDTAVSNGLHFIESLTLSNLPDMELFNVISSLNSLVALSYKFHVFNGLTVRGWRHLCGGFAEIGSRGSPIENILTTWNGALSVLLSLTVDTLESLLFDLSQVSADAPENSLEQTTGKVKLLSFFVQRAHEMMSAMVINLTFEQQRPCWVLLLRVVGVLNLVACYGSTFDELIVKTVELCGSLFSTAAAVPFRVKALMHTLSTNEDASYDIYIGACKLLTHLAYHELLKVEGDFQSAVAVAVTSLHCLAVEHTGALSDVYIEDLMRELVDAWCTHLSLTAAEPALLSNHLAALLAATCPTTRTESHAFLARQLLAGVLVSFDEADQQLVVGCLWGAAVRLLETGVTSGSRKGTPEAGTMQARVQVTHGVARSLRHVMLVMSSSSARQLLRPVLRACACACFPAGGRDAQDVLGSPAAWIAAPFVAEMLLKELPIAHLFCTGDRETRSLLHELVQRSVTAVVEYGGEGKASSSFHTSDYPAGDSSVLPVGAAVAVVCAVAGSLDGGSSGTAVVGAESAETEAGAEWAQLRATMVTNVALGTILLRWISSLSEHVKTLLCGNGPGASSPRGSTVTVTVAVAVAGRVARAVALIDTLAMLQRCFWSHRVPRAVQGILGRSALCLMQAAHAVSSTHASGGEGGGDRPLLVHKAMEYAGESLKLIGGAHFAEQSMEVVKQISAEWTAVALLERRTMIGAARSDQWKCLVLLLGALQSFANSLPAALRSRARELVAPELVPVIQARTFGRTFSLELRADMMLAEADLEEVLTMLKLGRHAAYVPCAFSPRGPQLVCGGKRRMDMSDAADADGQVRKRSTAFVGSSSAAGSCEDGDAASCAADPVGAAADVRADLLGQLEEGGGNCDLPFFTTTLAMNGPSLMRAPRRLALLLVSEEEVQRLLQETESTAPAGAIASMLVPVLSVRGQLSTAGAAEFGLCIVDCAGLS